MFFFLTGFLLFLLALLHFKSKNSELNCSVHYMDLRLHLNTIDHDTHLDEGYIKKRAQGTEHIHIMAFKWESM